MQQIMGVEKRAVTYPEEKQQISTAGEEPFLCLKFTCYKLQEVSSPIGYFEPIYALSR